VFDFSKLALDRSVPLAASFDTDDPSSLLIIVTWNSTSPKGNATRFRQSLGGSAARPDFTGVPAWFSWRETANRNAVDV
jgi:hypothetical protein